MKLDEFYEFVLLCHATNEKFESMLYEFQSTQHWMNKGNPQKDGVIVASKNSSDIGLEVIDLQSCAMGNGAMQLEQFVSQSGKKTSLNEYQSVLRHGNRSSMEYTYLNDSNYEFNCQTIDYASTNTNIDAPLFTQEASYVEAVKKPVQVAPTEEENPVKKRKFSCPHCEKTFVRKLTLKAHMSVHTKIKPFACDLCPKSFAMRHELTSHCKVHSGTYKCSFCPKSFSVPSKLERHERIHKNLRPYSCKFENCNKSFSDKRNLVGHEATHTDTRDFICEICSKRYRTKSQLNDHKKVHNDNAPYRCCSCGKAYKWKTNLVEHMRKHDGYVCSYCNKDCEKMSKFVRHRKECRKKNE